VGGARRIYEPSGRHCEPITAHKPGVKCPHWSRAVAQELLNEAIQMGGKLVATRDGVAFVAQLTRSEEDSEIWHGYPEAWDKIDVAIKATWQGEGKVKRKNFREYKTRRQVRDAFGGGLVGG
jgi:hypothetical protein